MIERILTHLGLQARAPPWSLIESELETRLLRNPAVVSRAADLFWRAVADGANAAPPRRSR